MRERFAVVLSSYRPDKDGMLFDATLFVRFAAALLRAVPHDSLAVETGGGSPILESLPELVERYARQDEMDRDPPLRMRASLGDRLVAVVETEAWASVGGPAPYHDSFTLSLYTAENRADEFRAVCEAVAHDGGGHGVPRGAGPQGAVRPVVAASAPVAGREAVVALHRKAGW